MLAGSIESLHRLAEESGLSGLTTSSPILDKLGCECRKSGRRLTVDMFTAHAEDYLSSLLERPAAILDSGFVPAVIDILQLTKASSVFKDEGLQTSVLRGLEHIGAIVDQDLSIDLTPEDLKFCSEVCSAIRDTCRVMSLVCPHPGLKFALGAISEGAGWIADSALDTLKERSETSLMNDVAREPSGEVLERLLADVQNIVERQRPNLDETARLLLISRGSESLISEAKVVGLATAVNCQLAAAQAEEVGRLERAVEAIRRAAEQTGCPNQLESALHLAEAVATRAGMLPFTIRFEVIPEAQAAIERIAERLRIAEAKLEQVAYKEADSRIESFSVA